MTFVSYAQNFEDVMLWRALKHVEGGFYIDVGANDPTLYSVTRAFYERGWHGVNIEPVARFHDKLVCERPRDINLRIGAGESNGTFPFFDIPDSGLATADPDVAEMHRRSGWNVQATEVPLSTLAEICEQHVTGDIHFLKIDVEGTEKNVLLGMDFRRWRPWVVVVEATMPMSQQATHEEWHPLLQEAAYEFVYFDGLNRFYLASERAAELKPAFATPPNVFDGFALNVDQESRLRAEEAESRANQSRVELVEAKLRADRAEAQVAAMKRSWSWRITRPLRWVREARARHAEAKAEEAEDKAREAENRADAAEVRAREAENRAREAETRAQQLQAQLGALHNQLQEVLASTSWKISAPLRVAGRTLILGKQLAREAIASPRGFARRGVVAMMRRTVAQIRRIPILEQWAWRLYGRFPVVGERLLRRLRSSGSAAIAPNDPRQVLAMSDAPLGWTGSLSQSGHFKAMLSEELRHRPINEAQQ